jgi:hypothetical protein
VTTGDPNFHPNEKKKDAVEISLLKKNKGNKKHSICGGPIFADLL